MKKKGKERPGKESCQSQSSTLLTSSKLSFFNYEIGLLEFTDPMHVICLAQENVEKYVLMIIIIIILLLLLSFLPLLSLFLKSKSFVCHLLHIYTMEYYSTIKANETVPFIEMWLDLETVIE